METFEDNARWQHWGNLAIGFVLFFSPLFKSYQGDLLSASWNACGAGIAILVLAVLSIQLPRSWEEDGTMLLGLWLIFSPWILKFSHHVDVTIIAVAAGVAVTILAMWALWVEKESSAYGEGQ